MSLFSISSSRISKKITYSLTQPQCKKFQCCELHINRVVLDQLPLLEYIWAKNDGANMQKFP